MREARPPIPEPVKRQVRQRCGFGCVVCGIPLYEYDHLVPWSEVQEHRAENIVLLCDRHHREKSAGLLPLEAVCDAAGEPFNRRPGVTPPYDLHYSGKGGEAVIGSNTFGWSTLSDGGFTVPLIVDDTPLMLFRVVDEQLLLTLQLFDDDDELLVQIHNNQLTFSAAPWDIEFVGRRFTVRNGPRNIFVSMAFETPDRILIDRAHVWRHGIEINVDPERVFVVNTQSAIKRCRATNCVLGIGLGDHPPLPGAISTHVTRAAGWSPRPLDDLVLRLPRS